MHKCPVDLREQRVQVRFDRTRRDRFVVFFNDQRMGEAMPLNLHQNAIVKRDRSEKNENHLRNDS